MQTQMNVVLSCGHSERQRPCKRSIITARKGGKRRGAARSGAHEQCEISVSSSVSEDTSLELCEHTTSVERTPLTQPRAQRKAPSSTRDKPPLHGKQGQEAEHVSFRFARSDMPFLSGSYARASHQVEITFADPSCVCKTAESRDTSTIATVCSSSSPDDASSHAHPEPENIATNTPKSTPPKPGTHRILELGVDLRDNLPHRLELGKHILLRVPAEHAGHLPRRTQRVSQPTPGK